MLSLREQGEELLNTLHLPAQERQSPIKIASWLTCALSLLIGIESEQMTSKL